MIDPHDVPQIPFDIDGVYGQFTGPAGINEIYLLYTALNEIQPQLGDNWVDSYTALGTSQLIHNYIDTVIPRSLLQSDLNSAAGTIVKAYVDLAQQGDPTTALLAALSASGNSIPSTVKGVADALSQYLTITNAPDGTSTSTATYQSGSSIESVTTTYRGPNGQGGPAQVDQENADGTSQITILNGPRRSTTSLAGRVPLKRSIREMPTARRRSRHTTRTDRMLPRCIMASLVPAPFLM